MAHTYSLPGSRSNPASPTMIQYKILYEVKVQGCKTSWAAEVCRASVHCIQYKKTLPGWAAEVKTFVKTATKIHIREGSTKVSLQTKLN